MKQIMQMNITWLKIPTELAGGGRPVGLVTNVAEDLN